MKNNNKILYISIAILVLAIGIAFGTYAYYQTTISGTISGNVAKWSFTANGQTSNLNLDLGSLYPGKSGAYDIVLSAKDSELDVYYELYIDPSGKIPLFLYWDSAKNFRVGTCETPGKYGTITAGDEVTLTLYFDWPYNYSQGESYDSNMDNSVPIHIVGQQLTGYTGSTPMYLLEDTYDINYYDGYLYQDCPQ
ncbi:MAG: hypothetical protein IJB71_00960 [Bacilli bacterium]|nr:hypothetical protein [Bacilli bacterium]